MQTASNQQITDLQRRIRKVAEIVLSWKTASIVGCVMATCIWLAFLRTVGYHHFIITNGPDLISVKSQLYSASILHPSFWPPMDDQRVYILLLLIIISVTRGVEAFSNELTRLIGRVKDAKDALINRRILLLVVEISLITILIGSAIIKISPVLSIIFAALGAVVFIRLFISDPQPSAGLFLLEIIGSLGAYIGSLILAIKLASEWLRGANGSKWVAAYYSIELHGFWFKDLPILFVLVLLSSLYLGYIGHGLGNQDTNAAKLSRRKFGLIVSIVIIVTIATLFLDFFYPSSSEFKNRCANIAAIAGVNFDSFYRTWQNLLIHLITERDIIWLMCGVVVIGLLYGILCFLAGIAKLRIEEEIDK